MLAIGGMGEAAADTLRLPLLIAHALALSGAASPRICLLNTAAGDDPASYVRAYSRFAQLPVRVSHLQLFPVPNVADPADLLLSQDVIFVGGGSSSSLAAVWQAHGLDPIMRRAWEAGVVMSGVSAGAICWFGGGTTGWFGPDLSAFTAGLGLLAGSYCPHYSSDPRRRPVYRALVAGGRLDGGIACDDGAAAHFADDELAEIVTDSPGLAGYRVQPDGTGGVSEQRLPGRLLARAN